MVTFKQFVEMFDTPQDSARWHMTHPAIGRKNSAPTRRDAVLSAWHNKSKRLGGLTAYRVVSVPGVDAVEMQNLGNSWTINRNAVPEPPWGWWQSQAGGTPNYGLSGEAGAVKVWIKAFLPHTSINWKATAFKQTQDSQWEVVTSPGSPVTVLSVDGKGATTNGNTGPYSPELALQIKCYANDSPTEDDWDRLGKILNGF